MLKERAYNKAASGSVYYGAFSTVLTRTADIMYVPVSQILNISGRNYYPGQNAVDLGTPDVILPSCIEGVKWNPELFCKLGLNRCFG